MVASKPPKPAAVPDDDDDLDLWNAGPPRKAPQSPKADSTTSEDESSDNDSEDSAAGRARQASAKLRDHNANIAPVTALPSADAAFTAVEGPPAFLDPEATRQIQEVSRSTAHLQSTGGDDLKANKDPSWDISRMAPKLKGVDDDQPQAGVISATAKRFKAGESGEAVPVSATQLAMLGGEGGRDLPHKNPSKAMGVEEFLGKGLGGAQLPRKRQEQKDKEKLKRASGQSTHSHWKSEAEMALRQQYD